MVAFLAVMRDGIELALSLTAAAAASTQQEVLIGALLGLGSAVILGGVLFATTVRLNLERFFSGHGCIVNSLCRRTGDTWGSTN